MNFITKLKKDISNLPGWNTKRKIIVIESDDWGSIRMPSLKSYNLLLKNGLDVTSGDSKRYNENDTLESASDLEALYTVLSKFKDSKGQHPVFTAVSIVANPDFEKIKSDNFQNYYYEPFTTTLEKYQLDKSFDLWREGISANLFRPQFHGREHLNVAVWMRELQKGDQQTLQAFEQGCWGYNNVNSANISYQAAFDLEFPEDVSVQADAIAEGLTLFENTFGYKASFFVPPNGPFNNSLEQIASSKGIAYMSASKVQIEVLGLGKTKKVIHYLGQKNKNSQLYITRNCFFEPSQKNGKNWTDSCMNDIENAFKWRKPAVISSHRVNFIGGLNENNRKEGLEQLESLLRRILIKWPNVEFMTSDELGALMQKK